MPWATVEKRDAYHKKYYAKNRDKIIARTNQYATCADVGVAVLEFTFTNATGSMMLAVTLYIQDNMGSCP